MPYSSKTELGLSFPSILLNVSYFNDALSHKYLFIYMYFLSEHMTFEIARHTISKEWWNEWTQTVIFFTTHENHIECIIAFHLKSVMFLLTSFFGQNHFSMNSSYILMTSEKFIYRIVVITSLNGLSNNRNKSHIWIWIFLLLFNVSFSLIFIHKRTLSPLSNVWVTWFVEKHHKCSDSLESNDLRSKKGSRLILWSQILLAIKHFD